MSKVVTIPETQLQISLYKAGRECNEYDVRLLEGQWPSDEALINLCDGAVQDCEPLERRHFGGFVDRKSDPADPNFRTVRVRKG